MTDADLARWEALCRDGQDALDVGGGLFRVEAWGRDVSDAALRLIAEVRRLRAQRSQFAKWYIQGIDNWSEESPAAIAKQVYSD